MGMTLFPSRCVDCGAQAAGIWQSGTTPGQPARGPLCAQCAGFPSMAPPTAPYTGERPIDTFPGASPIVNGLYGIGEPIVPQATGELGPLETSKPDDGSTW